VDVFISGESNEREKKTVIGGTEDEVTEIEVPHVHFLFL
jgi:hypothetical protein